MNWISTKTKLPEDGQKVLIYDGGVDVAQFVRGISNEDREKMKRGELPDPEEPGWTPRDGIFMVKRSDSYRQEDEAWNNERPYCWMVQGTFGVFGQKVEWWMPIPPAPGSDGEST